ncbi:MAG: LAGLIDADG family homing endonuclease, partial [Armatimonadota bacterium]
MDLHGEDAKLALSLRDSVLWGQKYLRNRDGSPRKYWPHQIDDLKCEDKNIIHLDGRDSGKCQVGSTLIADCNTGELVRLDQLKPGRRICVMTPDLKITTTTDYQVLNNGRKQCYRLRTATGRMIEVTPNHPLYTDSGWRRLDSLKVGDFIAVPRCLPIHLPENPDITDEEICLLAYFIADGGLSTGVVNFTKSDPIIVDEFHAHVFKRFPAVKIRRTGRYGYSVALDRTKIKTVRNPCKKWLSSHGLMGHRSDAKFIPSIMTQCSDRQVALFLSRLYGCDGWFSVSSTGKCPRLEVGYCSASEEIVTLVSHLLLRMGIMSSTRVKKVKGKPYWTATVNCIDDIRRFDRLIGFYGVKDFTAQDALQEAPEYPVNAHDRVPSCMVIPEVAAMKAAGISTVDITGNPNRRFKFHLYHPTRWLVDQYAENTKNRRLHNLASSDIYWDRVASIEPIGMHDTYDLSVPGYHNYVANDVIVHNSISLTTDVLHFAFTTRGSQGLIVAPHQGHLDTLIDEIEFQLETNPELMRSIAITKAGKPKISRRTYFKIEFSNGAVLNFRPAGAYGDSFRSLHVHRVWVDEGAWLPEKAWTALRQCLRAGGRLRIYSTPNGVRKSTYYRLTTESTFKVFHWPSWVNPSWDEERERELLE